MPPEPIPASATPSETRSCLIEAALACFAKYGYDATSIRLISSVAGKNSSLISYYFKSKEGLYREVFRFLLARFGTRPLESPEPGPAGPPLDPDSGKLRLHALIRRLLIEVEAHFQSEDPLMDAAIRLFMSEIQNPKEEVKDLIQERLAPTIQELRACLRSIRPDLSEADIDFWGITIQGGCVSHALRSEFNRLMWTSADPRLPLDAMADRLTDFAYHGLSQL